MRLHSRLRWQVYATCCGSRILATVLTSVLVTVITNVAAHTVQLGVVRISDLPIQCEAGNDASRGSAHVRVTAHDGWMLCACTHCLGAASSGSTTGYTYT
eukprot:TRINITY_DN2990_c0_g1_i1.p5 TRINITY_DN2990_c0_g1~~TRINITY_DN2990_c0_g1_i1.p5  ORF type:complete len:100 (-),score=8.81 TRINITY_DN2990_c0_g1_i1:1000-1299(-)